MLLLLFLLVALPVQSDEEKPAPIVIGDVEDARRAVGKVVRLQGTAYSAKLSAVVEGERLLVYCLDRASWSAEMQGRTVTVEGRLEFTEEFMAQKSDGGMVSQGTEDGVFVLRRSVVVPCM